LGLNSIIDPSFEYPNSQSILFISEQWSEVRKKYKPKSYDTNEYHHIKSLFEPLFEIYNRKKTPISKLVKCICVTGEDTHHYTTEDCYVKCI
jgi:hypothetical protein